MLSLLNSVSLWHSVVLILSLLGQSLDGDPAIFGKPVATVQRDIDFDTQIIGFYLIGVKFTRCRSRMEKDVFITQNAVGANTSSLTELHQHVAVIKILSITVCDTLLALVGLYFSYKLYRRCQEGWISNQIELYRLRVL